MLRYPRQAIAARPAHHAREGVNAHLPAELPDSRVRLIEEHSGLLAKSLEPRKQRVVPAAHEPSIEKEVRSGEDRRTVDVVLHLAVRLIADAHRPHSSVARQTFRDVLVG